MEEKRKKKRKGGERRGGGTKGTLLVYCQYECLILYDVDLIRTQGVLVHKTTDLCEMRVRRSPLQPMPRGDTKVCPL
jgi:hypothetical protein